MRIVSVVALLALAGPVHADESLVVVALGAPEAAPAPAAAAGRAAQGQVPFRPIRSELPSRGAPGLALLVDGRTRVLADPASGTLSAARGAGLDLGQVTTVLLGSTRPASTAELPTLLTEPGGPGGQIRLVGPGGGGPWPSTGRWVDALFGPSGLYASVRKAPRSLRLNASEVKATAERRFTLDSGVELRARTRTSPGGPVAAFRVERSGAALVLAGDVLPDAVPALTPLSRGAELLVASLPTKAAVRALADLVSAAKVRALWVVAAGDEVQAAREEARGMLEHAAPTVTWASTGRQRVPVPTQPAQAYGGCQTDSDCGPGKLCMGCTDSGLKECVAGCRSKGDCPAGQVCIQVQCIRCPCPPQCSGG